MFDYLKLLCTYWVLKLFLRLENEEIVNITFDPIMGKGTRTQILGAKVFALMCVKNRDFASLEKLGFQVKREQL